MRSAVLALVGAAALGLSQTSAPQPFDPVGKWTFATVTSDGTPMTGTMHVTGRPGAYTGEAVTSLNTTLPLRELMTSPNGAIILLDLPASTLVIRLTRGADGKFAGAWAEVTQTYNVTAEHSRGE